MSRAVTLLPDEQAHRLAGLSLTYAEVGQTRGPLPAGFHHVEAAAVLGHGRAVFDQAAADLLAWQVPARAGLRVFASASTVAAGADVVMRLGPVGIPCRVVYLIAEPDRIGFAYGTLPGHPETGEEAFVLTLEPDETVRFAIRAFSRPASWLTRLSGPAGRLGQRAMTARYLRTLRPPSVS